MSSIIRFILLLAIFTVSSAAGDAVPPVDLPFRPETENPQLRITPHTTMKDGVLTVALPRRENGVFGVILPLNLKTVGGKTFRMTAEIKAENLCPGDRPFMRGKMQIAVLLTSGKTVWEESSIPTGTYDWTTISKTFTVRPDAVSGKLFLGLQNASGRIAFRNFRMEEEKGYTIQPGEQWREISRNQGNLRAEGSALDLSSYQLKMKVGDAGRIIVNDAGHFAFERKPEQTVRFFCNTLEGPLPESHAQIEQYVREVRKNGFNMIRTHFLDHELMRGAKADLDFNPVILDRFDYLIYVMKENGIYLNFDLMTNGCGYSTRKSNDPRDEKRVSMHFSAADRAHWRSGVEKILCRQNPYTRTRLIDDPVLALAVAFNEQEFGFFRPFPTADLLPAWRKFLQQRYGTIRELRKVWKEKAETFRSFDDIPPFPPTAYAQAYADNDVAAFLRETEISTYQWYRDTMRELGYKGLLSNYNMRKNNHYNFVRRNVDVITINSYFAHPWSEANEPPLIRIRQESSLSSKNAASAVRAMAACRQPGKPLAVTEHGHVFCNRFRYEQAFATGAYAALNDMDALTCHARSVHWETPKRIYCFGVFSDPILLSQEFLTYFLFVRGDVRSAGSKVRILLDQDQVFHSSRGREAMADQFSKLSLLTKLELAFRENGKEPPPSKSGEIMFEPKTGAAIIDHQAGFSNVEAQQTSSKELVEQLKRSAIVPPANQSDGEHFFESQTGELRLDGKRCFMSIDAPRFQGICTLAGGSAQLTNFTVTNTTRNACIALVSVDQEKPLKTSRRMVLVYATNALNHQMTFLDDSMEIIKTRGGLPTLLETGVFTFRLNNRYAANLKLWALDLFGVRQKEIRPQSIGDDGITFTVDTRTDEPSVFFELAAEP